MISLLRSQVAAMSPCPWEHEITCLSVSRPVQTQALVWNMCARGGRFEMKNSMWTIVHRSGGFCFPYFKEGYRYSFFNYTVFWEHFISVAYLNADIFYAVQENT